MEYGTGFTILICDYVPVQCACSVHVAIGYFKAVRPLYTVRGTGGHPLDGLPYNIPVRSSTRSTQASDHENLRASHTLYVRSHIPHTIYTRLALPPSPPHTLHAARTLRLHGQSVSVAIVKGTVVRGQPSARPERARKAASYPLDDRGHARLLALLLARVWISCVYRDGVAKRRRRGGAHASG